MSRPRRARGAPGVRAELIAIYSSMLEHMERLRLPATEYPGITDRPGGLIRPDTQAEVAWKDRIGMCEEKLRALRAGEAVDEAGWMVGAPVAYRYRVVTLNEDDVLVLPDVDEVRLAGEKRGALR